MIARIFASAGGLVLISCLAGCGKSRPSPATHPVPPAPLVSQAEIGNPGGRFMLASAAAPKTFNPLLALDSSSDGIIRLIFSSLVRLNPLTGEPSPGLAESWSVAPDQKTWTFKLRHGVYWSDGQPLTAQDVVFTWNDIMFNPRFNQVTFGLFQSGGTNFAVTNLDAGTVRVVTPEVFAPFLEFFGCVAILPKHRLVYAVKQNSFLATYNLKMPAAGIVGCGPYRLKEYRPGKYTLLERNPEFWMTDRKGQRLPYFKEVMITISGSPGTDAMLFLKAKCDAFESVRPDRYEQFKQGALKGGFQLLELGPSPERDFICFNQNTNLNAHGSPIVNPAKLKWFRNKKFRQAISCAIDRERMVRDVHGGHALATYGIISTENPKWNNPKVARYSYDPARARALLAEIGIQARKSNGQLEDADGNPIEIVLLSNGGNPTREKTALMVQEDLKKIGIKLICLPLPFELLRTRVDVTFDYECALMGLGGGGVDPATQMNVLRSTEDLHQWFPFQKSPSTDWEARIDTLMDGQMRTLDFAGRKKAFDEVQAILAEELPMIYTLLPISHAAIRANIGNVRPSVLTPYHVTWNAEELFFTKP